MHVLDLRQLNRATLARQCLLERTERDVVQLVRRVGGLQAQTPRNPLVSLWSRMAGFDPSQLVDAIIERRLVRGTTLRGTLHLHEVDDFRAVRMTLQPSLDSLVRGLRRRMPEQDMPAALEAGRQLLEQSPRTIGEVKRTLAERFPDSDPQALGNLVRYSLQLLMVPDADADGGYRSVALFTPATKEIGDTLAHGVDQRLVLRRFLETLGPGTARDAQVWSGVRGLAAVARAMLAAGELIELATHDGTELLDLPDAPRPSGDTPAGVRFLPMWDNLLLSHADRSRVIDPAHRPAFASGNGMPPPAVLVDGFASAIWTIDGGIVHVTRLERLTSAQADAVVAEGTALATFLAPDAPTHGVTFA